jgi:hypothetical protein
MEMQELIFAELNGFGRALLHTGPAFDAVLGTDGIGFVTFQDINLVRADLHAVTTAIAGFSIYDRIHRYPKCLNIPSKSRIPIADLRF